jgi:polyisoprenoid-binding protein YceI
LLLKTANFNNWSFGSYPLQAFLFAIMVSFPIIVHATPTNFGKQNSKDKVKTTSIILKVVPEKSKIECDVTWLFTGVKVSMPAIEGHLEIIPTKISRNSTGFIRIYPKKLESINERVEEKAKKIYLETEKYEEITFTLTKLEGKYDSLLVLQENQLTACGILKLHGIKKEIVLYPQAFFNNKFIEFKGEAVVKMQDFGIKVPRFMFFKAKNDVLINFHIVMDYLNFR